MEDMTSYQNKYRKYLEDDVDTYLTPEPSTPVKIITGGLAVGGLFLGGMTAFKKGAMRDVMHSAILKMGTYRRGKIQAVNQGIRNFSNNQDLGKMEESIKKLVKGQFDEALSDMGKFMNAMSSFKEDITSSVRAHTERMAQLSKRELRDDIVEQRQLYSWKMKVIDDLEKEKVSSNRIQEAIDLIDQAIADAGKITQKEQEMMLKQTGFRYATIGDLIEKGELNEHEEWIQSGINVLFKNFQTQIKNNTANEEIKRAAKEGSHKALYEYARKTFFERVADRNIFIDSEIGKSTGRIADLRDFRDTFHGTIHSLTTDFTIPLIKINPLRMFYLDYFFLDRAKPEFFVSKAAWKNPIITGHNGSQQYPHLFVSGKVYRISNDEGIEQIEGDYFLAHGQKGPIARLLRNMSGISISRFDTPSANAPFLKRARYNIQSLFDVGFQDEPMAQFDFFDPTSWVSGILNKFTKRLQMTEYVHKEDYLRDAFGHNAEFIFMRKYKKINEFDTFKDYLKQFNAGRKNMNEVTIATLFPYGFFERLNATLNQMGLGLSNRALGNASQVFGNLFLKRVLPIWGAVQMWDYLNYESENLLGFQFEDAFAKMYANSSVELAKIRDALGITDWAKGVAPLLVGGEQIAEIPFLGNLVDLNQTAEETEEYWESGVEPVRKGRWWPLGNTPYTGSTIQYFEPNWVRRTLADVKFTDVQYGSREEYFENAWFPTPRHPFAPIRHFFTDPYHWEEKHYQDRPYMITGGIPEIEEFPLIGPLLNSTIGQILKPQKLMHTEYWVTPELTNSQPAQNIEQQEEVPVLIDTDINYKIEFPTITSSVSTSSVSIPIGLSNTIETIPEEEINQVLATYVTSSGQTSIVSAPTINDIESIKPFLNEKSPISTGIIKKVYDINEEEEVMDTESMDSDASLTQMIGNLHYNISEMAGFYGFLATSGTGELFTNRPILQSSSEISSYTRAFWDLDIGGYGGDFNEIFRRFIPKDRKYTTEHINIIPNTMPDWLPGDNYFIDFQTGDPYIKVKKGEMRLPGEGYEALWGIDSEELMKMRIGASFIGYDDETIRTHILKGDAYKDEAFFRVLKEGSAWHREWEREMNQKGIAIKTEQYVEDENAAIGGFYDVLADHEKLMEWLKDNMVEFTYYKASDGNGDEQFAGFYEKGVKISDLSKEEQEMFYQQLIEAAPQVLIDPKTRGTKSWEKDEMHFENVQQVNFYATNVGTPINYLIHVDRQRPEKGIKVFAFEQNPYLYEYSLQRIENVRQGIRSDIEAGRLHRGDLYDIVDRYRILADVAPYSEEFRTMKAQISNMGLSEKEMEEIRKINEQVSAIKNSRLRVYPYRFKTANVEDQVITVDHVIDSNTFIAKEFPDNPIRLAGVRVSVAEDNPVAEEAAKVIGRVIHPGAKIRIAYDADEYNRVKDDTYKTIQAVVYDQKGRNLNKYLIDKELGKEKENDFSPAAVHARFTPGEIKFGALWEEFAHMDTMLHTKMLQVRSPIEQYERREVYGKDWQEWVDPIEDYLIPFIQNSAMHNPILAIGGGALLGAMFGSLKPTDLGVDGQKTMGRYGKIVGAAIGASIMSAVVLNRMLHEAATGERWIPERRLKERETEEYFDILEYIKYNRLFNQYATLALREEGFDVKEYLEENKNEGELRQQQKEDLENLKRQLYIARPNQVGPILVKLRKEHGIKAENKEEAMKEINAKLNELTNSRKLEMVTPLAAKAIQYYQAQKQTMYGYEPGDPIANVLAALPKKERQYLTYFIEAPEEERPRILQTVPTYVKRVLQSAWGMPVDEKIPLQEYFMEHPLPGANWGGWNENVSIDDIKVKFVNRVGLDPSEFDIWPDDEKRAEQIDVETPNVFKSHESQKTYQQKLKEILTGFNVQGLDVNVVQSNKRGLNSEVVIEQNRKDDVQRIVNQEGYHIL